MQLNSSDSIVDNMQTIQALLDNNTPNIDLLVLPENALLITNNTGLKQQATRPETIQGIFNFFSQLAKQHQCWLVAGSLLVPDKDNPNKYFNQCPIFSPDGKLVKTYKKIHLFDADLGSESWQESATITAGHQPTTVSCGDTWKVGLSICYDLRFPELYRAYSKQGCNILTVPAAFTVPTGKAHWETLLRARAIENQSYTLAAGQVGAHQDNRETYGHSLIIDPWGEVLAELEHGEGILTAALSYQHLSNIRQQLPTLKHHKL